MPKSKLAEGGGLSAADRRLAEAGVERLLWRATLRPANLGVAAFADEERDYAEIVVMTAELRPGAKAPRLVEVVHRAVTAPLVLVVGGAEQAALSIGVKRRHEREAVRRVVERLALSPPVGIGGTVDDPVQGAFLASLDLARLPAADLYAAHRALEERAEAYAAGRATGVWRLPGDETKAGLRRGALERLEAERRDVTALRMQAARATSLAARVALSHKVEFAEAALTRTVASLA